MLTSLRVSGSYFAISTGFACQMVTFINTFYHFMLPLTPFRYLHIMATEYALWSTTSRHFSRKGLTSPEKYAKFSLIKAVTKTRAAGKIPREVPIWCKGAVPLPSAIPLPSRVCGNATPGAPVKASMSDGYAVTRVEPWNTFVSHP